ncbi:hypothetical protein [Orrella daihaiensis]|uniref:Uncharacterized protein n=1 Tax=Orrella daihaiensis TaxID=2782176 RepID=A0ABY4AKW9_9BURK|nr:hypothetical protein [Orrella daihaiensis]UOD50708.1 hypothetical protein DHf2319_01880 [Orrella daihaiensis]
MLIHEITTATAKAPHTPAQARIAALQRSVDTAQHALKSERKRQKVQTAQQRLQQAVNAD